MKFTYNWIKKFLDTDLTPRELGDELTKLGIELESIIDRSLDLSKFKVAYIQEATQHPNADKLKVCSVDTGSATLQIVCGASNARSGIKVVLAEVGTLIPNGGFAIKASEIRGVKSNGMLCSADELGIKNSNYPDDGIIELDNDAIIGDGVLKYLGIDDVVYDVSVTPNRGDWLGVYGIARDLAAKKLGILKEINPSHITPQFKTNISAKLQSNDAKFIALREIKNVRNSQSPAWLKNLLTLIGIEPISAIVDITNYFSISFARPLHAYDKNKVGDNFIVKNLSENSEFSALNGKKYSLSSADLVICDENSILSIAGIIGGENSKCDETTSSIILESAVFDRVAVTKLGRKHNIITDSRARFERGIDENYTIDYGNLAASMIMEITGGIASNLITQGEMTKERFIEYNLNLLSKRIGISSFIQNPLDDLKGGNDIIEKSEEILSSLGFKIISKNDKILQLQIPSWRHDINCQEIIAEEIARIIGYEAIENHKLEDLEPFKKLITPEQKRIEILRRKAASIGYLESITYSFMSSKISSNFADHKKELCILNPISSDLDYLRPTIIPNLIKSVANNLNRSASNISIFEIGPVFDGLEGKDEITHLSAVYCGEKITKSHCDNQRNLDFFDIKSDVEQILSETGIDIKKLIISKDTPRYYHPGRSAIYKLGNKLIAYMGEIHPKIKEIFDIKQQIFGFEIFIDNIPIPRTKYGKKTEVKFSQFQPVSRDFAFILDNYIQASDLIKSIINIDELIRDIEIFDLYSGANIGEGKKSIALRVNLQSFDKTLIDEEIEEISKKIIATVESKFLATLRNS